MPYRAHSSKEGVLNIHENEVALQEMTRRDNGESGKNLKLLKVETTEGGKINRSNIDINIYIFTYSLKQTRASTCTYIHVHNRHIIIIHVHIHTIKDIYIT